MRNREFLPPRLTASLDLGVAAYPAVVVPSGSVANTGNKKARRQKPAGFFYPGNDLLSHSVTRAVPSALEGLTSVFGMGTGVTPPPWSPGTVRLPE